MNRLLSLLALVLLLPLAAHAGKSDSVVVDISTSKGPAKITLVRKGNGFVGPRGEYYPEFPSKKTLEAVYGAPSGKPSSTPKPEKISGDFKIVVVSGGVNIKRGDKVISKIRTKYPDVRGYGLWRDNTQIAIKSGVGREPGFVELFDVKTGQRLDKISAKSVTDGKPAWAKKFAE